MSRLLAYLFELIVAFIVARGFARLLQLLFGKSQVRFWSPTGAAPPHAAKPQHGEAARDPVCGMFISTELSHRLERGDQTLHFCSRECLERFQKGHHDA